MSIVIECLRLTKSFKKLDAVKEVNLEIEKEKIYGLIGRNGAGKTTLLHLLTGQYAKDGGDIKVFGQDVFENREVLENICLVKEKESSLKDHKVKEIFRLCEIFYKNWDNDFKERLIEEFELNINKRYKHLSRGMKSSVSNIIGLASRGPITIFDEPSIGLDAAMRDKFYKIILEDYQEHKRTIILSTHLIDEVSNLFEDVIIMDKGKILLNESVEVLTEKAYYITGNEKSLEEFIENKEVIYKESFGSTAIMGCIGELTQDEKMKLKGLNMEIDRIPLQKLFIYLTEGKKGAEQ